MRWNQDRLEAVFEAIQARAAADPLFFRLALAAPEEAWQLVTGEAPPKGVRISFFEEG